jgi:hypothetical protein
MIVILNLALSGFPAGSKTFQFAKAVMIGLQLTAGDLRMRFEMHETTTLFEVSLTSDLEF